MVIHPDPISGAIRYLGELSIHIPANDVAVTGARPRYFTTVIMLPEGIGKDVLVSIVNGISSAANSLNATVVGGHTEFTTAVTHPIVITTAFGFTRKDSIVQTSRARHGDILLMTKFAGIEGTAVLATDFREELVEKGVDPAVIDVGASMIEGVSVVKEALILAEEKLATAMHDPTEGGVLAGAAEIAAASNVSIEIDVNKVPIHPVTYEIAEALGVDPLKMLSSGALLATVPADKVEDAIKLLTREGVEVMPIGVVIARRDRRWLVRLVKDGKVIDELTEPYVEDEIMRLWSRKT